MFALVASVALVPRAEQDIRAALNVLALNFSLNDKVVEELLKVGVRNLEEFRFLFEDEAKVGAFVAKIGLGDEATSQTARLRRAWNIHLGSVPVYMVFSPFWMKYKPNSQTMVSRAL